MTKRFSVSLTDEMYTALEDASAEAGQDMSRLIRDAIAAELKHRFGMTLESIHPPRGGDMRNKAKE
jgi:metal-responsive CopG/Arc/MetJ family transcriptional regulator